MIAFLIIIFIIFIIILVVAGCKSQEKIRDMINDYNSINVGDSRERVISILGNNFTQSILKDGTEKLVYKIQNGGSVHIRGGKGFSTTSYSPVKKVTIKLKDNKVISKEGLNLID